MDAAGAVLATTPAIIATDAATPPSQQSLSSNSAANQSNPVRSNSSSSSSSGYGSTTTTPTNNYESQATTPVGHHTEQPAIPIATVAAVTPFFNEAINTHVISTQQQKQDSYYTSTYEDYQQQEQQQKTPNNLSSYNVGIPTQFDASSVGSASSPSSASSPALSAQQQQQSSFPVGAYKSNALTPIHYEHGGANVNLPTPTAGAINLSPTLLLPQSPNMGYHQQQQQQQVDEANNGSKSLPHATPQPQPAHSTQSQTQHFNGILATSKQRSFAPMMGAGGSSVMTSKPQAAATPFYAQPLTQQHSTMANAASFYEKHKMQLDYYDNFGNPTSATYHQQQQPQQPQQLQQPQYHHQQALQQKYYATSKSHIKEANFGSPAIAAKQTLYPATNSFYAANQAMTPNSPTAYDKFMYSSSATPYPAAPTAARSNEPSLAEPAAATTYRKPSNSANSWPWGIDYASGHSRTIPPPAAAQPQSSLPATHQAAASSHIPTATVAPTHATYMPANAVTLQSRTDPAGYYVQHDKYAMKYDKYGAPLHNYPYAVAPPSHHQPHQTYASAAGVRHMWPASHSMAPLSDRMPHSNHHLPPPPHHLHPPTYFSATNAPTALNARQTFCPPPYQTTQSYYYPPPPPPHVRGMPPAQNSAMPNPAMVQPNAYMSSQQSHSNVLSGSCKYGGGAVMDYGQLAKPKTQTDLYAGSPFDGNPAVPHPAHQHSYGYASAAVNHSNQYRHPNPHSNMQGPGHSVESASATYNDLNLNATGYDSFHHDAHAPHMAASYGPSAAKRALMDYRKPIQPQPPPIGSSQRYASMPQTAEYYTHPQQSAEIYQQQQQQQQTILSSSDATNFGEYGETIADSGYATSADKSELDDSTKNLSLRDFIANWNDDEDDYAVTGAAAASAITEEMDFDQNTVINEVLQAPTVLPNAEEAINMIVDNSVAEQGASLITAVEKSLIANAEQDDPNQFANLPDIVIDTEKSSNTATIDNNSTSNNALALDDFDVEKELDEMQMRKAIVGEAESTEKKTNNLIEIKEHIILPSDSAVRPTLATQLSFEDLNLEAGKSATEANPEQAAAKETECGYESGNSGHSNESAFEKEYETFINKISTELPKTTKRKKTQSENDFEQKLHSFSKFYKRKRKLKEENNQQTAGRANESNDEQGSKKPKAPANNEVKMTNFPQVYTRKARNRRLQRKLKTQSVQQRRRPMSTYYKLMRSMRRYRLLRMKRVHAFMTELKEKHLPLIKRKSMKEYSQDDNVPESCGVKSLMACCLNTINSEEFRLRIMLPLGNEEQQQEQQAGEQEQRPAEQEQQPAEQEQQQPKQEHICEDPTCETCDVIRSLMEPEYLETLSDNIEQAIQIQDGAILNVQALVSMASAENLALEQATAEVMSNESFDSQVPKENVEVINIEYLQKDSSLEAKQNNSSKSESSSDSEAETEAKKNSNSSKQKANESESDSSDGSSSSSSSSSCCSTSCSSSDSSSESEDEANNKISQESSKSDKKQLSQPEEMQQVEAEKQHAKADFNEVKAKDTNKKNSKAKSTRESTSDSSSSESELEERKNSIKKTRKLQQRHRMSPARREKEDQSSKLESENNSCTSEGKTDPKEEIPKENQLTKEFSPKNNTSKERSSTSRTSSNSSDSETDKESHKEEKKIKSFDSSTKQDQTIESETESSSSDTESEEEASKGSSIHKEVNSPAAISLNNPIHCSEMDSNSSVKADTPKKLETCAIEQEKDNQMSISESESSSSESESEAEKDFKSPKSIKASSEIPMNNAKSNSLESEAETVIAAEKQKIDTRIVLSQEETSSNAAILQQNEITEDNCDTKSSELELKSEKAEEFSSTISEENELLDAESNSGSPKPETMSDIQIESSEYVKSIFPATTLEKQEMLESDSNSSSSSDSESEHEMKLNVPEEAETAKKMKQSINSKSDSISLETENQVEPEVESTNGNGCNESREPQITTIIPNANKSPKHLNEPSKNVQAFKSETSCKLERISTRRSSKFVDIKTQAGIVRSALDSSTCSNNESPRNQTKDAISETSVSNATEFKAVPACPPQTNNRIRIPTKAELKSTIVNVNYETESSRKSSESSMSDTDVSENEEEPKSSAKRNREYDSQSDCEQRMLQPKAMKIIQCETDHSETEFDANCDKTKNGKRKPLKLKLIAVNAIKSKHISDADSESSSCSTDSQKSRMRSKRKSIPKLSIRFYNNKPTIVNAVKGSSETKSELEDTEFESESTFEDKSIVLPANSVLLQCSAEDAAEQSLRVVKPVESVLLQCNAEEAIEQSPTFGYLAPEAENSIVQSENPVVESENPEAKVENPNFESENPKVEVENSKAESENPEVEVEISKAQSENSEVQAENCKIESENPCNIIEPLKLPKNPRKDLKQLTVNSDNSTILPASAVLLRYDDILAQNSPAENVPQQTENLKISNPKSPETEYNLDALEETKKQFNVIQISDEEASDNKLSEEYNLKDVIEKLKANNTTIEPTSDDFSEYSSDYSEGKNEQCEVPKNKTMEHSKAALDLSNDAVTKTSLLPDSLGKSLVIQRVPLPRKSKPLQKPQIPTKVNKVCVALRRIPEVKVLAMSQKLPISKAFNATEERIHSLALPNVVADLINSKEISLTQLPAQKLENKLDTAKNIGNRRIMPSAKKQNIGLNKRPKRKINNTTANANVLEKANCKELSSISEELPTAEKPISSKPSKLKENIKQPVTVAEKDLQTAHTTLKEKTGQSETVADKDLKNAHTDLNIAKDLDDKQSQELSSEQLKTDRKVRPKRKINNTRANILKKRNIEALSFMPLEQSATEKLISSESPTCEEKNEQSKAPAYKELQTAQTYLYIAKDLDDKQSQVLSSEQLKTDRKVRPKRKKVNTTANILQKPNFEELSSIPLEQPATEKLTSSKYSTREERNEHSDTVADKTFQTANPDLNILEDLEDKQSQLLLSEQLKTESKDQSKNTYLNQKKIAESFIAKQPISISSEHPLEKKNEPSSLHRESTSMNPNLNLSESFYDKKLDQTECHDAKADGDKSPEDLSVKEDNSKSTDSNILGTPNKENIKSFSSQKLQDEGESKLPENLPNDEQEPLVNLKNQMHADSNIAETHDDEELGSISSEEEHSTDSEKNSLKTGAKLVPKQLENDESKSTLLHELPVKEINDDTAANLAKEDMDDKIPAHLNIAENLCDEQSQQSTNSSAENTEKELLIEENNEINDDAPANSTKEDINDEAPAHLDIPENLSNEQLKNTKNSSEENTDEENIAESFPEQHNQETRNSSENNIDKELPTDENISESLQEQQNQNNSNSSEKCAKNEPPAEKNIPVSLPKQQNQETQNFSEKDAEKELTNEKHNTESISEQQNQETKISSEKDNENETPTDKNISESLPDQQNQETKNCSEKDLRIESPVRLSSPANVYKDHHQQTEHLIIKDIEVELPADLITTKSMPDGQSDLKLFEHFNKASVEEKPMDLNEIPTAALEENQIATLKSTETHKGTVLRDNSLDGGKFKDSSSNLINSMVDGEEISSIKNPEGDVGLKENTMLNSSKEATSSEELATPSQEISNSKFKFDIESVKEDSNQNSNLNNKKDSDLVELTSSVETKATIASQNFVKISTDIESENNISLESITCSEELGKNIFILSQTTNDSPNDSQEFPSEVVFSAKDFEEANKDDNMKHELNEIELMGSTREKSIERGENSKTSFEICAEDSKDANNDTEKENKTELFCYNKQQSVERDANSKGSFENSAVDSEEDRKDNSIIMSELNETELFCNSQQSVERDENSKVSTEFFKGITEEKHHNIQNEDQILPQFKTNIPQNLRKSCDDKSAAFENNESAEELENQIIGDKIPSEKADNVIRCTAFEEYESPAELENQKIEDEITNEKADNVITSTAFEDYDSPVELEYEKIEDKTHNEEVGNLKYAAFENDKSPKDLDNQKIDDKNTNEETYNNESDEELINYIIHRDSQNSDDENESIKLETAARNSKQSAKQNELKAEKLNEKRQRVQRFIELFCKKPLENKTTSSDIPISANKAEKCINPSTDVPKNCIKTNKAKSSNNSLESSKDICNKKSADISEVLKFNAKLTEETGEQLIDSKKSLSPKKSCNINKTHKNAEDSIKHLGKSILSKNSSSVEDKDMVKDVSIAEKSLELPQNESCCATESSNDARSMVSYADIKYQQDIKNTEEVRPKSPFKGSVKNLNHLDKVNDTQGILRKEEFNNDLSSKNNSGKQDNIGLQIVDDNQMLQKSSIAALIKDQVKENLEGKQNLIEEEQQSRHDILNRERFSKDAVERELKCLKEDLPQNKKHLITDCISSEENKPTFLQKNEEATKEITIRDESKSIKKGKSDLSNDNLCTNKSSKNVGTIMGPLAGIDVRTTHFTDGSIKHPRDCNQGKLNPQELQESDALRNVEICRQYQSKLTPPQIDSNVVTSLKNVLKDANDSASRECDQAISEAADTVQQFKRSKNSLEQNKQETQQQKTKVLKTKLQKSTKVQADEEIAPKIPSVKICPKDAKAVLEQMQVKESSLEQKKQKRRQHEANGQKTYLEKSQKVSADEEIANKVPSEKICQEDDKAVPKQVETKENKPDAATKEKVRVKKSDIKNNKESAGHHISFKNLSKLESESNSVIPSETESSNKATLKSEGKKVIPFETESSDKVSSKAKSETELEATEKLPKGIIIHSDTESSDDETAVKTTILYTSDIEDVDEQLGTVVVPEDFKDLTSIIYPEEASKQSNSLQSQKSMSSDCDSKKNSNDIEDFHGFKDKSCSFDYEEDDTGFHGFEDLNEEERLKIEFENLYEGSMANDGFPAAAKKAEVNELEALEKEISQQQIGNSKEKLESDDMAKKNQTLNKSHTEEINEVTSTAAVSTNDIENIKKMLESDEENQIDNENPNDDLKEKPQDIPKLSDLCRAALNSSLYNKNNNKINVKSLQTSAANPTYLLEREISVEEALAEMYRQAGVLLSDPEDNDDNNANAAGQQQEAADVLLLNLEELLNSDNDNVYVLQCDLAGNAEKQQPDSLNNANDNNNNDDDDVIFECNNQAERVNSLQFIQIVHNSSHQNTNDDGGCSMLRRSESYITILSSDSDSEVIILSDNDMDIDPPSPYSSKPTVVIPFITDSEAFKFNYNEDAVVENNDTDEMATDLAMIHHEEIVPDNLKKFLQEEFFKYLHEKYVQKPMNKYFYANRILKKYRRSGLKSNQRYRK